MLARTLLVLLALSVVPTSEAVAATALGDSSGAAGNAPAGSLSTVPDDTRGAAHTVPAGGGVITSLTVRAETDTANVSGAARIMVLTGKGSTPTVLGGVDVTVNVPAFQAYSSPARIPVVGGERLAAYASQPSHVLLGAYGNSGAAIQGQFLASAPTDGSQLNLLTPSSSVSPSISAVLEPDADHDGYGDESQDSCPNDPAVHSGGCTTDLVAAMAVMPTAIPQGTFGNAIATITNTGKVTATDVVATLVYPLGAQVLAASTPMGACDGSVTCQLGDIPPGKSQSAIVGFLASGSGPLAFSVVVRSGNRDANPANDTAAATLTVTPAVSAPSVQLTQSTQAAQSAAAPSVKLCTVPSLKGKTATAAKAALAAAGCGPGVAKGSKAKTAKVTTQTIPSKVIVVAGTKVGFTLSAPKKSKVKKK